MSSATTEQILTESLSADRLILALDATKLELGVLRRYLRTEKGRQTMEEVRLDSIARTLRGKEPYDLIRETVRRVLPTVRALVRAEVQRQYRERLSTALRKPTCVRPHQLLIG